MLSNDLEAEYPDIDQAVWEQLRRDVTSVPWKMVSAAGLEQAAACIGQGAPTVVYLDGGTGGPAAVSWSQAAVAQSGSNRACLFDRPGMGLSPAQGRGGGFRDSPEQDAQEMLAMLQVLGEPGPYLLTGWSYGGLVARTAAAQHPEQVAGMVLVDASSPLQTAGDVVGGPIWLPSVGEGPDMGNRPVIVLEAERLGGWPAVGQPFVDAPEDAGRRGTTCSSEPRLGISCRDKPGSVDRHLVPDEGVETPPFGPTKGTPCGERSASFFFHWHVWR